MLLSDAVALVFSTLHEISYPTKNLGYRVDLKNHRSGWYAHVETNPMPAGFIGTLRLHFKIPVGTNENFDLQHASNDTDLLRTIVKNKPGNGIDEIVIRIQAFLTRHERHGNTAEPVEIDPLIMAIDLSNPIAEIL